MNDRKASLLAATFGCVAIGGFWLARPMKLGSSVRVVDQWTPSERHGPDGDAAAMIRIDLRGANREEDRPILYRVVGENGVSYPLSPAASPGTVGIFKLQRGYAQPIASPRLVVSSLGRTIASTPLKAIPPPERHLLTVTPNAPIRLVLRGNTGLFAEPIARLPEDERWRVVARRTPFADDLETASGVQPVSVRFGRRLAVPFVEEAGLVEVELTRYRLTPQSETVHVGGFRLERRYGGTALVVDRPTRLTSSKGTNLLLPKQDNGPRHPVRNDLRIANANLLMTPAWMLDLPEDLRRGRGPYVEILSPKPETLGLRELRIASQTSTSRDDQPIAALREGPFSATLRLTFFRPVAVERKTLVLPVVRGAPSPYPEARFASDLRFFRPD